MKIIAATLLCALMPQDFSQTPTSAPETQPTEAPSQNEDLLAFNVVRPESMAAGAVGPVLLALPPGSQTAQMVAAADGLYWREEALAQGWTVISPIAPEGGYLGGDTLPRLHELIDHIEATYAVEGGKLHLAGVSNGGRAAFELALDRPDRFASLSLLPGMPNDAGMEQLERLADLPMAMYVGGDDKPWLTKMREVEERMTELGFPPERFTVLEGEGHTPTGLTGKTLFQTLETFRLRQILTDFHDAASKADSSRYFNHFADQSVFIGTDATERWTRAEFQAFAEPYFSKGQGWTYTATERHTYVSEDGNTAWFDELLDSASYGVTRGTGVFVCQDHQWKLTQYHLTIPVPNDLAKNLVELIRAEAK